MGSRRPFYSFPTLPMGAWHPFTGRGVAAFASASNTRTLLLLLLAAASVGGVFVWSLSNAWFPVIDRGIQALPPEAAIRSAKLLWGDARARRLAENATLDWVVRPKPPGPNDLLGQSSDLRIELRGQSLRFQGALGHLEFPYPATWDVPLGRIPALAAWNSWRPYLSVASGIAVAIVLLAAWTLMASAYCIPAWLVAHVLGKRPTLAMAWRLSAASLVMGAVVGAAGIAAYASGIIRIPGLLASQVIHVPIPWVWLLWGILSLDLGGRSSRRSSR